MSRRRVRLLHVAGARPNFMKIAPIMAAVEAWNAAADPTARVSFSQVLVHTGQHYDRAMSEVFFADLGLPAPDHDLGVGSGSHAAQTAAVLERLEPVLLSERPDLLLVVGDVNSTVAAALCAVKLGVPVAHVEAGLRSFDRSMPEEVNRVLTDQVSELLFTTEAGAATNLAREGIEGDRVRFVGNTMIDSLERLKGTIDSDSVLGRLGVRPRDYALVTLHRPSNVDEPERLAMLVRTLREIARKLPVIWPVHVRTTARLREIEDLAALTSCTGFSCLEAMPYTEFLALMSRARLVLTDSGGVQEETTVLGIPCLTLRTSTERPVTVTEGTNHLVDPSDGDAIRGAVEAVLSGPMPSPVRPGLWDGHAAERIVEVIAGWAAGGLGGRAEV
jgi:UDP-N-acetylglucosamine 2-epimerase (non-hydrolysing)